MLSTRVAAGRGSVAVVTALAMVFTPLVAGPAPAQTKGATPATAPTTAPAAAPAGSTAPVDGGWPRAYATPSGGGSRGGGMRGGGGRRR